MDQKYSLVISSENPDATKGFSIWFNSQGRPALQTIPKGPLPMYNIVFNPLHTEDNLLPVRFLEQPFPDDLAEEADYRLTPATDDKPHFNLIRKKVTLLYPTVSKFLDGGTAQVLNWQILPFLSSDLICFFVVGVVSIFFAMVFVFIPLVGSSLGRVRWEGRGWYLVYFSCLGAAFIIIELTFVQLFSKLIGFPTQTFATVLFSLLFSAGIGSIVSKKLGIGDGKKWKTIFWAILIVGGAFIVSYQQLFAILIEFTLPVRIITSVALIFPLGFFMGMPFPLGMYRLGQVEFKGIPWAWGMNAFFTVLGGFMGMILAVFTGFKVVLVVALLIYMIAALAYGRVAQRA